MATYPRIPPILGFVRQEKATENPHWWINALEDNLSMVKRLQGIKPRFWDKYWRKERRYESN
jgi:hypothetical protein